MMLSLTPIVERLQAAKFRQVEGLLEFGGLRDVPRQLPALFVVPTSESAQANTLATGGHDQKVVAGWSVMLVLDAARRQQVGVSEDLRDHSKAVRRALVGWQHPEASGATAYAGGRLASADAGAVVWAIQFTAACRLRETS